MKNLFVMVLVGFLFYCCTLQEPEEPRSIAKTPTGTSGITASTIPPVYYSQFGAKGDGMTDDFNAIIRTHDAANIRGARVMADPGKTYYIGASTKTASIRTDTDWGDAKFIIDDTKIEKRGAEWADSWIFTIESAQKSFPIYSVSGLEKGQSKLPLNLGQRMLLVVTDNTTRRYIRRGTNETAGSIQTDMFIIDKDGNVDPLAPILWDFNNITTLTAYPIDDYQLKVTGGHFTTIANRGNNLDLYMKRGIRILRSNVLLDGLYHDVVGGDVLPVVAYTGFISTHRCADVTIKNTTLTGRLPMAGKGTYDIQASTTINLSLINCDQTNDNTNTKWWGIFASNYVKNILFDNVSFSRFDAHMGVHNATIRNSNIGHSGMLILGSGTLRIENTSVTMNMPGFTAARYITIRDDYGSTWEGDLYITNAKFVLGNNNGTIIHTNNNGQWNFGYECFMPTSIYIDGFHVENSSISEVELITNGGRSSPGEEAFPYALTDTIFIKGYRADTGRQYLFSNSYLRNNIHVVTNW